MELNQLQYHWNGMGQHDPMFAVLTEQGKEQNRWQRDEFFETGRLQIAGILNQIAGQGVTLKRRRALDFGCAVGRLSQALCDHFDEVDGVDIAPSMLQLAREWNQHGRRCRYHLNEEDSLRLFKDQTFDFICTMITLQHMQPKYAANYIAEFARVLVPGGTLIFQVPDQLINLPAATSTTGQTRPTYFRRLAIKLRKFWDKRVRGIKPPTPTVPSMPRFYMEMYCIPEHDVVSLLGSLGLNVVSVGHNDLAGPHYISKTYLAQRQPVMDGRMPVSKPSNYLADAA